MSGKIEGTDITMIKAMVFCLGKLKPEDTVIIDMDGRKVEGMYEPSLEAPFHLALYKNRIDMNAVVQRISNCNSLWHSRDRIVAKEWKT